MLKRVSIKCDCKMNHDDNQFETLRSDEERSIESSEGTDDRSFIASESSVQIVEDETGNRYAEIKIDSLEETLKRAPEDQGLTLLLFMKTINLLLN